MTNKKVYLSWILLFFTSVLLAACKPSGQEGEMTGIKAQIGMNQAEAGNIEDIAYLGSVQVLLLETNEVITASCPEELLLEVEGAPAFNVDEIEGGFIVSIEIKLDKPAKVLVAQDSEGNWEVTKILE